MRGSRNRQLRRRRFFHSVEIACWFLGILLLGLYALVWADRRIYQAYTSRELDREIQTMRAVTPRYQAPLPALPPGALLGRISIPRIGLRAMVADGTSEDCLRKAVGHIEGTALPGQIGNAGLAGHRDTFFRGLSQIRKGDVIEFQTPQAKYEYVVESTRVVSPDDVDVLAASSKPELTLVTCFPFHYIGPAPDRFIVQARLR